ncbi:MAG: transglutaminase family protein [Smithellaceae bacterium]|nr:transglutaminase family protein [Smithellaceae bacterium]
MKKLLLLVLMIGTLIGADPAFGAVAGTKGTTPIRLEFDQQVPVATDVNRLSLSFVVPANFRSATFRQVITDFGIRFSPRPQEVKEDTDARGNRIITAAWMGNTSAVDVSVSYLALNEAGPTDFKTQAPFPLERITPEAGSYLKATAQVQADDPRIRRLAAILTSDAGSELDAVRSIISYVIDHMTYVTPPSSYDALYALETGKGNCQNYSHLSAALLRASGIPARIVKGFTINERQISYVDGKAVFKMGKKRHSWIEVWFSDLGWVPFDPQSRALLAPKRFLRVEVGLDNNETRNDGLIRRNKTVSRSFNFATSFSKDLAQ